MKKLFSAWIFHSCIDSHKRLLPILIVIVFTGFYGYGQENSNFNLSHFLVYRVVDPSTDVVATVDLNDQFDTQTVEQIEVSGPRFFCNPVVKRHDNVLTPILDQDHHLTNYRIENKQWEPRRVEVRNQFTEEIDTLRIGRALFLLTPSRKQGHDNPVGLDHYTCYRIIGGDDPDITVDLRDQFGAYEDVEIGQARYLCLPSEKIHEGNEFSIRNADDHLIFYEVSIPAQIKTGFRDQFQQTSIQLDRVVGLLVPTKKRLLNTGN